MIKENSTVHWSYEVVYNKRRANRVQNLTNLSHIQAQICHVFVHCRCRFLGAVYPNLSKTVVVSASPGAIDKIKDIEDQVKEVEASFSHILFYAV